MMKNNQDRPRKVFTLFLTLFILFSLVGFDLPPASTRPVDDACDPLGDANCASAPERKQANDLEYGIPSFAVNYFDPEDIKLSSTRVLEGQPINTIVGSFSTIGAVLGPYTYSLVPGEGGSDNGSFNILGDQLRTSAEFNAEIKNSYDILVRSTNTWDLYIEKHFRITITQAGDEMFTYLPLMIRGNGFNSQFDGHADGWVAHSGFWVLGSSGGLVSPALRIGSSSVSYVLNFTNFDYQVSMGRLGRNLNANRIFVRGTPTPLKTGNLWYSGYAFQYTRNGWYSVLKHMPNGDVIILQGWTSSSAINPGDAINVLRVVANGDHFSFYINGTLVWQGRDSSFSSGRVGIGWYWDGETGGMSDALVVYWAKLIPLGTSSTQGLGVPDPIAPNHQTIIDEVFADGYENEVFIP